MSAVAALAQSVASIVAELNSTPEGSLVVWLISTIALNVAWFSLVSIVRASRNERRFKDRLDQHWVGSRGRRMERGQARLERIEREERARRRR